jgi:heptosyltransferase-2
MSSKTLIIRFSSLGDVILTLPVVESIKHGQPDTQIDFLTNSQYSPLVELFPGVDNVYGFDKNVPGMGKVLIRQKYNTVIDLQKNPRSIIFTARINPKNVVSYPKRRWQRELMTKRLKLRLPIGHTVDAYLAALQRLKIKPISRQPKLELSRDLFGFADVFIERAGIGGKIIGLCPGSKHFEKRWPDFAALADKIIQDDDKSLIIFSSPEDDFETNLGISSNKVIAAKNLQLDQLAAVMSKCDIVVANDSGLMHLAVALNTPAVAIFGPTHPDLGFAPLGQHDKIVSDFVACSPCSLHGEKKCRLKHKICFEKITPERIKSEIDELIKATGGSQVLRNTTQ